MPARRRRQGSESEQPFIIVTDNNKSWPTQGQKSTWKTYAPAGAIDLDTEFLSEPIDLIEPVMTSRDRTNEFVTAIRSMQGRNIARAVAVRDPRKAKVIQSHSEFMYIAKSIGKNIASTYTKLEKLTLCK